MMRSWQQTAKPARTLKNEPVNVFPTAVITYFNAVQRKEDVGLSVDPQNQRIEPFSGYTKPRDFSGELSSQSFQLNRGTCNEVES